MLATEGEGARVGKYDAEARPARHRADDRGRDRGRETDGSKLPALAGVLALATLVGGGFAAWAYGGTSADPTANDPVTTRCGSAQVRVAASPEVGVPLRSALRDAGCSNVVVELATPVEVSRVLVGGVDVPDYWVPDSALWEERTRTVSKTPPSVLVDSIASSPVVLASAAAKAPATWTDALRDPGMLVGDPLSSTSAAASLLLGSAGAPEGEAALLVARLAQAADPAVSAMNDDHRIAWLETLMAGVTAASEQELLSAGSGLVPSVPDGGTWLLDYPMLVTAPPKRAAELQDVSARLAEFTQGEELATELAAASFRPASGAAIEGGVGSFTTVPLPSVEAVTTALGAWSVLAVPIRSLAVVDVSGSMDFPADHGTRMDVTVAAMQAGMSFFPDSGAVGLWAFSEKLDGSRDHRELVPIRHLGDDVDGTTQRAVLAAQIGGLSRLTTGGTGLYDTVLAAFQDLQRHYDPDAVNSILLFSDGANDDPGSISEQELVDQLTTLQDPKRPIQIIAIGITHDADEAALTRIATASGGFSMIAERPEDMAAIFEKAMEARF